MLLKNDEQKNGKAKLDSFLGALKEMNIMINENDMLMLKRRF